jgi:hypothetical protein
MLGIPTPYIMGGLLLIGFVGGYKVKDWQCDAAYAKALEKAEKQRAAMQQVIDSKSTQYEEVRNAAEVTSVERTNTIKEIYKSIPAPPADCPTPPDGVVGVLKQSIRDTDTPGTTRESGVSVQEPERASRSSN